MEHFFTPRRRGRQYDLAVVNWNKTTFSKLKPDATEWRICEPTTKFDSKQAVWYKSLACMPKIEGRHLPPINKTAEDFRREFRMKWLTCYRGEVVVLSEGQTMRESTERGSAYELVFNPMNQDERTGYTTALVLQALQAGYEIVATVTIPGVEPTLSGSPLTSVTYFLKNPLTGRKLAPVSTPPRR